MTIDASELPLLTLRLQIQLEPFGIKLDTNAFKTMMEEDNGERNRFLSSYISYMTTISILTLPFHRSTHHKTYPPR